MALHLKSTGIDFADISSGDVLDDYEEGTWTPTNVSSGATWNVVVVGTYTKIARLTHIMCYMDTSGETSGTKSNPWTITGLPFTSRTGGIQPLASAFYIYIDRPSGNGLTFHVVANATTIKPYIEADNTSPGDVTAAAFSWNDSRITIGGTYETT